MKATVVHAILQADGDMARESESQKKREKYMEKKGFAQEIDRWIQENRDSMREALSSWLSHPSVSRADL